MDYLHYNVYLSAAETSVTAKVFNWDQEGKTARYQIFHFTRMNSGRELFRDTRWPSSARPKMPTNILSHQRDRKADAVGNTADNTKAWPCAAP